MALTLLISENAGVAFVDKTAYLANRSLSLSQTLDMPSEASFRMVDPTATLTAPKTGQPVKITDGNSTVYFFGSIDSINISLPGVNSAVFYECVCVDYNQVLDRHLVAQHYTDLSIESLVYEIIHEQVNKPTDEGILFTKSTPDNSDVIEEIKFNFITAKEALNRLAVLGTYFWNIGSDKRLTFAKRGDASVTATALTDDSSSIAIHNSLTVTQSREQYRNVQYAKDGYGYATSRTDGWTGDGLQTTFETYYPIGKNVTATVNGSDVSIEVEGTTADFNYNSGEKGVTGTLADGSSLRVTYLGLYTTTASDEDADQITARIAIEGGSGRYETADNVADMLGSDTIDNYITGMLSKFGVMPNTVQYQTDTAGFLAGTLQPTTLDRIDVDGASIDENYLIENVSAKDIGQGRLRYSIKSASGEALGSWEKYFQDLQNANKSTVFDNAVIIDTTTTLTANTFELVDGGLGTPAQLGSTFYIEGAVNPALVSYSEVS